MGYSLSEQLLLSFESDNGRVQLPLERRSRIRLILPLFRTDRVLGEVTPHFLHLALATLDRFLLALETLEWRGTEAFVNVQFVHGHEGVDDHRLFAVITSLEAKAKPTPLAPVLDDEISADR